MKKRKIPLRKCTGCQEMKEKKTLMRIVRNDEGQVFLDPTGKSNGRGAYVCKDIGCLEKAHKTKGLERSFKAPIPVEIYEKLRNELIKYE